MSTTNTAAGRTGHQHRWLILGFLCLSLVLIGLDTLILNLALPRIQVDLDASSSELRWFIDAYAVGFGGLLLLSGGLADRFGPKRMLLVGLVGFMLASIVAAYSANSEQLIVWRALMGVSAALIMPATLAIIKYVFPVEEQGRAIGLWGGAAAIGVPLGPALAGFLLEHFWWGALFLINMPISLVALLGGALLIPRARAHEGLRLDWIGGVLSIFGLVAAVYGLVQAPEHGWNSVNTAAALGTGAVLLLLFIWREATAEFPMMPLSLFNDVRFRVGFLSIFSTSFGLYSALLAITFYLQAVLELEPLAAGIRMLTILPMVLTAALSPILAQRVGLGVAVAFGLVSQAAAFFTLIMVSPDNGGMAMLGLALLGVGVGLTLPAATDAIVKSTPPDKAGAGSALADVGVQVGGAFGIALAGSVLITRYRSNLPDLSALPDTVRTAVENSVISAVPAAQSLGPAAGSLLENAKSAFIDAVGASMIISIAVAILGALLSIAMLARHHGTTDKEVTDEHSVAESNTSDIS